jgi:hypothetical protein
LDDDQVNRTWLKSEGDSGQDASYFALIFR